jgi:hypothetical protein
MSFVKGHQHWRKHSVILSRFAAGFTAASVAVFGFAALAGAGVNTLAGRTAAGYVSVAGLAAAALLDLYAIRKTKWCPVSVRRQAPQAIMYELGMKRAALAWGLDAGLVFSTFRVSAISWAVMLGCLTGLAPWWTGLAYAAGFLVPLGSACSVGGVFGRVRADRLAHGFRKRSTSARVVAAGALAASLTVVAASVV